MLVNSKKNLGCYCFYALLCCLPKQNIMEKKYFIVKNANGEFDENSEVHEFIEFKEMKEGQLFAIGIKLDGSVNIVYFNAIKFVKKVKEKFELWNIS